MTYAYIFGQFDFEVIAVGYSSEQAAMEVVRRQYPDFVHWLVEHVESPALIARELAPEPKELSTHWARDAKEGAEYDKA